MCACLLTSGHIERNGSARQRLDRDGEWLVVIVIVANQRGGARSHEWTTRGVYWYDERTDQVENDMLQENAAKNTQPRKNRGPKFEIRRTL